MEAHMTQIAESLTVRMIQFLSKKIEISFLTFPKILGTQLRAATIRQTQLSQPRSQNKTDLLLPVNNKLYKISAPFRRLFPDRKVLVDSARILP
jgi:hypothetical protein